MLRSLLSDGLGSCARHMRAPDSSQLPPHHLLPFSLLSLAATSAADDFRPHALSTQLSMGLRKAELLYLAGAVPDLDEVGREDADR